MNSPAISIPGGPANRVKPTVVLAASTSAPSQCSRCLASSSCRPSWPTASASCRTRSGQHSRGPTARAPRALEKRQPRSRHRARRLRLLHLCVPLPRAPGQSRHPRQAQGLRRGVQRGKGGWRGRPARRAARGLARTTGDGEGGRGPWGMVGGGFFLLLQRAKPHGASRSTSRSSEREKGREGKGRRQRGGRE